MKKQLPPLSLYIHFPWCIQKCPYCDFNSHAITKGSIPESRYIEALLRDLENDLPLVWGRKINTIFMGGGTPSLFSPEAIDTLLAGIRARIPVSPNAEITLEANPGTLENQRLIGFRQAGINRVSIGVQSFNDEHLIKLGRIHNAATAVNAIESAKTAGFDNFNIDLMFALPNQSIEQTIFDIETAISLSPTHISYYQLTIEPNTAFHHQPPQRLPDDELSWNIFSQGKSRLSEGGFHQYEVSAYATPGKNSRHNMNYWQFGDYLGIGAGAHAKISDANQQSITRYWKHKHPTEYLSSLNNSANSLHNNSAMAGTNTLKPNELVFEFLLNALRLTKGFELEVFKKHTGLEEAALHNKLQNFIEQGLIIWDQENKRVNASDKGQLFLNDILEQCLPND